MPAFPSLEWMQAYAAHLADHPEADAHAVALAGRFRFVITPHTHLEVEHRYDLVGDPDAGTWTAERSTTAPALLTVRASCGRWRDLVTGRADFVRSFLLRRLKVDGDLGEIRRRAGAAPLLLDAMTAVETTFP